MSSFSYAQNFALRICPIVSGSLSFISSSTITIMILKCDDKLAYPFRRIIFGLSISDVIQSLSMILAPFSLPREVDVMNWSTGNQFTCDLQGFSLHVGFAGVPMYVLSLSVYFLCAVKYNLNDKAFARKIEPYLHGTSILWTVIGGIACWATSVFNVMGAGNVCWYTPFPANCITNDDVECIRGEKAFTFGWIFGGSNAITLVCIIYCLVGVCRTVTQQEKRNAAHRFVGSINSSACQSEQGILRRMSVLASSLRSSANGLPSEYTPSTALRQSTYIQRNVKRAERRKRETMTQAALYIVSFLASCVWAYLYGLLVTFGVEDIPFTICLLFSIFYPLGGFFNILVYTRPKVLLLRKRQSDLSWLRAFGAVIRAGVEVPEIVIRSSQSSRSSARAEIRGNTVDGIPEKHDETKLSARIKGRNSIISPLGIHVVHAVKMNSFENDKLRVMDSKESDDEAILSIHDTSQGNVAISDKDDNSLDQCTQFPHDDSQQVESSSDKDDDLLP